MSSDASQIVRPVLHMPDSLATILLVDDEEEDLLTMRHALESRGYRILEAGNYDEGISLAKQLLGDIDLVVTDIALPGPNGCELAKSLLRLQADLKLLFVSGYAGAEICCYYGIAVADLYFMRKPITPAEFVIRVQQVLESKERSPLLVDVESGTNVTQRR